jgi:hypothetical protein
MKSIILVSLFLIFSCQHKNVHKSEVVKSESTAQDASTPSTVVKPHENTIETQTTIPKQNQPSVPLKSKVVPNFGIIFSAGGARTWAHVGMLKEMQKFKFPVVSVVGIEWGAVVAAIYAQNLSSNEVEWEMSKFKSLDKTNEFIQSVFAKKTVADMKSSFACPSLNVKSQTVYLLNRGNVDQFLPFCIPSPALAKPYGQSVALMTDVSILIQHLRATGVQKILLLNVLNTKEGGPYVKPVDSLENQTWAAATAQLVKKNIGIDEVISINISDVGIDDFDQRREIMAKGAELSYSQIKKLADKYGL